MTELAYTSHDQYIIPVRWIEKQGAVYAESYAVSYNPELGEFKVDESEVVTIMASTLVLNYLDIVASMSVQFSGVKLSRLIHSES